MMLVRAAFATLHFQLVLVDTFALKMGMELGEAIDSSHLGPRTTSEDMGIWRKGLLRRGV
jgi:hypothetical protein